MSENVQPAQKKLTPRQIVALTSLLTGATHEEAAQHANVTAKTIQRWHEQPRFKAELRTRGHQALQNTTTQLAGGLATAVAVLREVYEDATQPPSVRVRAAKFYADLALRAHDVIDMEERLQDALMRLEMMEQQQKQAQHYNSRQQEWNL